MSDTYATYDLMHAAYLHYLNPEWYVGFQVVAGNTRKAFIFSFPDACEEIIDRIGTGNPVPIYDPYEFFESHKKMKHILSRKTN